MTSRDVSATPAAVEASTLVEAFVKSLNAYQRELKLYPEEHPRLRKRVQSLLADLKGCISTEGDLLIDVRGEQLFVNNSAVDDSSHAQQLLRGLRLRMIRAIRIAQGVSETEVQALANLLGRDSDLTSLCDESLHIGPGLDVFYFAPGTIFEALEGNSDRAEAGSALPVGAEWEGFTLPQVETISKVLRIPHIRQTIQDLTPKLHLAGGNSFAATLFHALRDNPATDWQNLSSVRDLVLAGLDLVWRHSEGVAAGTSLPEGVAAEPAANTLTTQLRWMLLQKFFPNAPKATSGPEVSPIAPNPLPIPSAPVTIELTPELEVQRTEFRNHFQPSHTVAEFLEVVGNFEAQLGEQARPELRRTAQEVIRTHLARGGVTRASLGPVTAALRRLPDRLRIAWTVEVLHGVARPEEVFAIVCDEREPLRQRLLASPPDLQKSPPIDVLTDAEEATEVLRRLFAHRDAFALDLLFCILEGPAVEHSLESGWLDVINQTCARNEALPQWLELNTARLASPAGARFALAVPADRLREWITSLAPRAPHLLKTLLQLLPSRTQADATSVIEASLACSGSSTVRIAAIEALGSQSDAWSYDLLKQLLRKHKFACRVPDEVERICQAIAARSALGGRLILNRVLTERRLFVPLWNRRVRNAARRALAADEEAS